MTSYRLRIRPTAPWVTPWRADSLFGSLCWSWRNLAGETALLSWLDRFRGGDPPFVLSDAFPDTCLPAPLGAPISRSRKAKPPFWIEQSDFQTLCAGSPAEVPLALDGRPAVQLSDRLHASLGRQSCSTEGGQLFEVAQYHFDSAFFKSRPPELSLYVRTPAAEDLKALLAAFRALSWSGFGKKSSVGLGAFHLPAGPEPAPWLDPFDRANGFVALSHFVPAAADPSDGSWHIHVSYPKFNGDRVGHFLKGRLLTLTPGSTFYSGSRPRPWYGRMISLPRPGMDGALHYGLCFAAPAIVPRGVRHA